MSTLIVGNSRTEEMAGELVALSPAQRRSGGCAAQRLLWFAGAGDVLLLPYQPPADYRDYVTGLTATEPESLLVLCPPPDGLGADLLTPDRIADAGFREQVRAVVRERGVDRMLAVYKDVPVMRLAAAVGLQVPGHAFSAEGGDAFLNSKACFRAIAAGVGVPLVAGLATGRRAEAQAMVSDLLAAGNSAIVKQEFAAGGYGNEILSPVAGVRAAGAFTSAVLADASAVCDYFDQHWNRLTAGGRHRLIVEHYLTGCDTVYSEYLVGDDGPVPVGVGEILMSPLPIGEIVPPQVLNLAARSALVAVGMALASAYHAIGYRGYLSVDALLTPAGDLFISETNARMSGSTHLHVVINDRLLAAEHRDQRVIMELHDWVVPSFAAAVEQLAGAGLAFDKATGTGVVLTSTLMPDRSVAYCVVAPDLAAARTMQTQVLSLFDELAGTTDSEHGRLAELPVSSG
ncbi:MAG: hypothetical protein QOE23_401 [Pseudonocardiales bacterium]|nr:hypothetical protein [Pseudonocardiales bacterium]